MKQALTTLKGIKMNTQKATAANVMKAAWAAARKYAAEQGGKPSLYFIFSLREAWANAKSPIFTTYKGNKVRIDFENKIIVSVSDGRTFAFNNYKWTAIEKNGILAFFVPDLKSYIAICASDSERIEEMFAEKRAKAQKEQAKAHATYLKHRDKAVPGIEELRDAYHAENDDYEHMRRVIESGSSVFMSSGKNHAQIIADLKAKYPRAAVWLKADGYEAASNFEKSAAGRKAKKLLEEGGSIAEAEAILGNWINNVYID